MMSQKQILALTAAAAGAFLQGCSDNSCEDVKFGDATTYSADCNECLADQYTVNTDTDLDADAALAYAQEQVDAWTECGGVYDQCMDLEKVTAAPADYSTYVTALALEADTAACASCVTLQYSTNGSEDSECKKIKKAIEDCSGSTDYEC